MKHLRPDALYDGERADLTAGNNLQGSHILKKEVTDAIEHLKKWQRGQV